MITASIWLMIIVLFIGSIFYIIRGIPGFLRESRLKNEEEKWRQKKEKEFIKSIEWEKHNLHIYEMRKDDNPYKREQYYLFQPQNREYWIKEAASDDYAYYTSKFEFRNLGGNESISFSDFFFHNETLLDPIFKAIFLMALLPVILVLLLLSPIIIGAKLYQYIREHYSERFGSTN